MVATPDLEALEALAAKINGPLRFDPGAFGGRANVVFDAIGTTLVISHLFGRDCTEAFEAMVAATNAAPALTAEVRRLRAEVATAWRDALEEAAGVCERLGVASAQLAADSVRALATREAGEG